MLELILGDIIPNEVPSKTIVEESNLRLFIGSWNVNCNIPNSSFDISKWFPKTCGTP